MFTILLVDDPLSLRLLGAGLRAAGFAVMTARTGAEALAEARRSMPDLVVTNAQLDGNDGFALVEALRQLGGTGPLPAIFVSSRESSEERARARAQGVDDLLIKPILSRELVARVHLALARRARRAVAAQLAATTDDIALADLLLSLEASRTTGIVHLWYEGLDARIYLRDGNVVDGELGRFRGAEVIHRALQWTPAAFLVERKSVDNVDLLECSTQDLLLQAMDRLDGRASAPALPAEPEPQPEPHVGSRETSMEGGLPSTAPWTRESGSSVPVVAETDLVAAGLPLLRGRMMRQVAIVAAAVGVVTIGTTTLASWQSRHTREDGRAPSPAAAASPVASSSQPTMPPVVPPTGGIEPPAPAPEESAVLPDTTSPPAAVATKAAEPVTGIAAAAPATVALSPRAGDPHEAALDLRTTTGLHESSPLARDAQQALLKGEIGRALALAQQAVAANAADANGWLTLAAARKASGDLAGARDAYSRCVADARTFGVMSCRALAVKAP